MLKTNCYVYSCTPTCTCTCVQLNAQLYDYTNYMQVKTQHKICIDVRSVQVTHTSTCSNNNISGKRLYLKSSNFDFIHEQVSDSISICFRPVIKFLSDCHCNCVRLARFTTLGSLYKQKSNTNMKICACKYMYMYVHGSKLQCIYSQVAGEWSYNMVRYTFDANVFCHYKI